MISRALGAEQVAQFADFPQFPKTDAGQNQLVEAFREAAKDTEHAERITAWLIRGLDFAPLPVDIYRAAAAVAIDGEWEPQRETCRVCGGDRFTHQERNGCSFAVPCRACRPSVKGASV